MYGEGNNSKNAPLVTAIITTHNRYDLALKAINSVQSQTYDNLELIVIDDASDEDIKNKLATKAGRDGFQYIYIPLADSKGGDYARNLGILNAKGKYVAFLDDDDEWMPQKIEKQVYLLENNDECKVCYCGQIRDYNNGEKIAKTDTSGLLEGDLGTEIFVKWQCLSSEMMADRDLLLDVGMFDESLRFWQDYELCMRLFQRTKVCVVRECLILYRVIQADPQRLTNKIDGWEDAVAYILKKHASEFDKLSQNDIKRRNYYWNRDGAARCESCGNKKRERYYLWEVFLVTHNPKDLLKVVLNISRFRDLFPRMRQ